MERLLTDEQVSQILKRKPTDMRQACGKALACLYLAGLRSEWIRNLRVDQVDIPTGIIYLDDQTLIPVRKILTQGIKQWLPYRLQRGQTPNLITNWHGKPISVARHRYTIRPWSDLFPFHFNCRMLRVCGDKSDIRPFDYKLRVELGLQKATPYPKR